MLSDRFERAFSLAFNLHQGQVRKGSGVPYVGHLLAVAALVIENGGSEDEAIAALLHDAPEDQGGAATLARIEADFGTAVANLVLALSDTLDDPKPPWRERKATYLEQLYTAPQSVLRISLADKLHNARSIVADHQAVGPEIWARFKGGQAGTKWYYNALLQTFSERSNSVMLVDFESTVHKLQKLP